MGTRPVLDVSKPFRSFLSGLGELVRASSAALPPSLNPLNLFTTNLEEPPSPTSPSGVRGSREVSNPIMPSRIEAWLFNFDPKGACLATWITAAPEDSQGEVSNQACVRRFVLEAIKGALKEVATFDYLMAETTRRLDEDRAQGIYISYAKGWYNLRSLNGMPTPVHVRAECVRLFSQVLLNPLLRYPTYFMTLFKNPIVDECLSIKAVCAANVEQHESMWTISVKVQLSIRGIMHQTNEEGGGAAKDRRAYLKIAFMLLSKSKGPINNDGDAPGWDLSLKEKDRGPNVDITFQFTEPVYEEFSQFPPPRQMNLIRC